MLAYNLNHAEIHEFSVHEISNKIKLLLEENFGLVRIKGEISGLKIAASGHVYFNLKDNISVLACICWKHAFSKLKFKLNDGLEVTVVGKITSYSGQSKYQLSVETIDPSGLGAMMQILNERKERLDKEGLFDPNLKKRIPFMPQKIGVITSITGSVLQDILHRIRERCPTNILIWPCLVQGELAAQQITTGILELNKLEGPNKPNVIILARGGGSIEDLWCFNEESVVRAIADSQIPVISAVGHETDYTLSDFAADLRAPTPTAAAEFVSPNIVNIKYTINSLYSKLKQHLFEVIKNYDQALNNYGKIIRYSLNYLDIVSQKLDEVSFRLSDSLPKLLKLKSISLEKFSNISINPEKIIKLQHLVLGHKEQYLQNTMRNFLLRLQNQLNICSSLLASLDYNNVLKRGYAIIESENGKYITSAKDFNIKDKFEVRFWDGKILVGKS